MGKTEFVTKGISMLPEDWGLIERVAAENGQGRSAAMRQVVREYPVAQRLMVLGQAYLLDLVTAREALERLAELAMDVPLPISLTDAGRAAMEE